MSFLVWTEIVCHNCADTSCGQYTTDAIDRRRMKKLAKTGGWIFLPNNETYCCEECVVKWQEILEGRERIYE